MFYSIGVYADTAYVYKDQATVATLCIGESRACKIEAEAREAAELLKAFFEAKAAGKVARLVTVEKCTCGPLQFCGKNCDHEQKAPQANPARERREAFRVAKLAAVIFAHNAHDFDERRAVQSAAKILGYAEEGIE